MHEVDVRCDDLIYPVFVTEGENVQSPIESMPGIYHYSLDRLAIHLKEVWEKGVRAVIFSGCRIIRMPAEAVLTTGWDCTACLENNKGTLSGDDLYCGYLPL